MLEMSLKMIEQTVEQEPIERQKPSQREQEEESIADLFSDAQNTMRSFYNEMIRFLAGRNPREIYDVDDKEAFHLIRLQMNDIRNFLKVMHAQLKEYVGDKHRGDRPNWRGTNRKTATKQERTTNPIN